MSNANAMLSSQERASYQNIGLILGPAVFAVFMLAAGSQQIMPDPAFKVAAVGLWMAIWWSTEALPVPVTAFLPIVTFDLLGIASIRETTAAYAHPTIYLFLGAFILALAVEKWNLHKRVALVVLSKTGTDGKRLIGGFMLVAAMLSMWMTNTSTTMMLLPIAMSVAAVITDNSPDLTDASKKQFKTAMLLGLAFAATIGGLSTLIGTPPNVFLQGFLQEEYQIEISFALWMMVGVPIAAILLPTAWVLLTRIVFKVDIAENQQVASLLQESKQQLGAMTSAEKRVGLIFLVVVAMWIMRARIGIDGVSDASIAITAALVLFMMPSGKSKSPLLLQWSDVARLPWGVLILFGGGLSLASAVKNTGLALWLGESLAPLSGLGIVFLIVAATCLVIFLTELTSNLATAATFLPVIAALAVQTDINPLMLCVPVTLAASCAFMLPVATPPNAIVFSSGMITIPQMVRAGVALNALSIVILTAVAIWLVPAVFG